MLSFDIFEILFVVAAFLFQLVLIIHFALRKWRFNLAIRYGKFIYALGIPFAILSAILLLSGKEWSYWLGGFIFLVWAVYGYIVEYVLGIEWRTSLRWSILIPFVILYLATVMFYWWPLAPIYKPLWYVAGTLFLINTYLNVTSHQSTQSSVSSRVLS